MPDNDRLQGRPATRPWTDTSLPADVRVDALLAVMTVDEKLAQLGSVWDRAEDGSNVAPMEDVFNYGEPFEVAAEHGIGHLTRVFGTRPIDPDQGRMRLAELQQFLIERTRLGVPAIAHEECLTGFTTYGATVFPTPLAWAATFDPGLVEQMAAAIGASLRAVGVHQGLAPVLDVVRDYRWGRVEETMGEDPYLVATLGTAYVIGLQSAGVIATLKHFAGYSASRAGRNHGPVSMGRRELADVILPPFEMAVASGAGSVMNSYADVDGVPSGADPWLLTELLRDEWGFSGTVVSDYWAVSFLETMHRVAESPAAAGTLALLAGVDVELPDTRCYGDQLAKEVDAGHLDEALVDRAVRRVLLQKLQLGLLDADWAPDAGDAGSIDLDPPAHRTLARRVGEESVVLLVNAECALPLLREVSRIALVGPCADDPLAFLGCYSYPNHVLPDHPELGLGVPVPTLVEALRAELPLATVTYAPGCSISEADRDGFPAAVEAAQDAELAIVVVGDRAGLFGRGTSGEGCDVEDLELPGVQAELVDQILATGTPVVLVVVSGRPYALGAFADRAVAIVQAFFPGQEGGRALAGVLSGRIVPSGRLPVQVPASPGGQPGTYLHPLLGEPGLGVSSLTDGILYPFGHGISYTSFAYADLQISPAEIDTSGEAEISCTVTNTGDRTGVEVVQLYLSDPVAQVTRPVKQLTGYARIELEPGQSGRVCFRLHAERTAYLDQRHRRMVEPGRIDLLIGASSADVRLRGELAVVGQSRAVAHPVLRTPTSSSHRSPDAVEDRLESTFAPEAGP